jgi:predicted Ser/Thr protein kinase
MTATALSARSRLGPYQIVSLLGAGGMGEVYRARDTRLQRDVAIKVLPMDYGDDPELLKRLEREARAVSQLNHSNIVAVYDVGSEDGVEYVVMELLEGETLGKKLASGPLPSRRVLDYATQIARGLAAAHEKDIIHRDLKPENIFVTRDGRVKILDFGLARQLRGTDPGHATSKLTTPGMVVGTASYMSPEQTRGLPLDRRSDIFSFGVVLFEMLSGKLPFEAETAFETMTAILHREAPDLRDVVPSLPPILYRVVTHCLEKSPDARFQSAQDLVFDLENCSEIAFGASGVVLAAPPRTKRPSMRTIAAAVGLVLIFAAALTYWTTRLPAAPETSFRRLTFRPGLIPSARFTPDGESVVYSESWKGQPLRVHVLRTDQPESQALAIPNADLAAISRTGDMAVLLNARSYDWTGGGTLAVVPVLGGTPRQVVDRVMLADWLPDGQMAVWRTTEKGEQQLEFPLGKVLYTSPNIVFALRVSPKGDQVALNVRTDGQKSDVVLIGLDGSRRTLASAVGFARGMAWTPDGKEIWFTSSGSNMQEAPTLFAVDMQGRQRMVMRAPGWPWLHDIARDGKVLMALVSSQGGIIVQSANGEKGRDLSWLDASILADVSSDGKYVLFTESNEGVAYKSTVYMRATDDSAAVRLGEGIALGFSPRNDLVLALRAGEKRRELLLLQTGAGKVEVLPNDLYCLWAGWLPDGRILINAQTAEGPRMFVQARDGKPPRPVTPPGVSIGLTNSVGGGAIKPVSPDGRSLLVFDRENRAWLYPIGSPAGQSPPRLVAGVLPGDRPGGWSSDGRHVYVFATFQVPAKIHDVDVVTGERRLHREFALPDIDGVFRMGPFLLMPDGHSFAYGYYRQVATLYTATGLR